MRTIGILGGMGPVATAEFLGRVVRECEREYHAVQDGEYPPVLLYSMSLQGSDESGIKHRDVLVREFAAGARKLERAGCDFLVIPCNTAHELLEELHRAVRVPILSIIDLTVDDLARRGVRRAGVLASESSLDDGVYARPLAERGIRAVVPNAFEKRRLVRMILAVMGGRQSGRDRREILRIARRLHRSERCDAVLIGCTELSVVRPSRSFGVPTVDAMDVLATATVRRAYCRAPTETPPDGTCPLPARRDERHRAPRRHRRSAVVPTVPPSADARVPAAA